jgi:DnaJ-class molecular chaperone
MDEAQEKIRLLRSVRLLLALACVVGVLIFVFMVPLVTCRRCRGLGQEISVCGVCDGTGKATNLLGGRPPCRTCRSKGEKVSEDKCARCDGSKRVPIVQAFSR